MPRLLALAALLSTAVLTAQSVVVPNANETVGSTGLLNNPLRNANNARTYMIGINASQLTGIATGALITGVSLRAGNTTSNIPVWPATGDIAWADYEITVGNCLPTGSWSSTYMSNFVTAPIPPVTARDGPMVVQQGAVTNVSPPSGTPNAWSEFYFDFQLPFLYLGGDLAILFTHPGSNDPTSIWFEQVASNPGVHGIAMAGGGFQATTATSLSYVFVVARIHYGYGSPSGCPGTGGMSGRPIRLTRGTRAPAHPRRTAPSSSRPPAPPRP